MDPKRLFRTLIMILLAGVMLFGLAACRLPASAGPDLETPAGSGFPVPGETGQVPTQSDITRFATQTARVNVPILVTPQDTQTPSESPASPVATNTPNQTQAPSTEVTYVQPTQGEPPATYVLQPGEYPFCIARRFDINQGELLQLNNLNLDSFVGPGTELKIPQTGNPFEGDRSLHDHPTTYKIQAGDNLNRIACYFGDVSPDMIYLQNNLHSTDLPVGEVLIIP